MRPLPLAKAASTLDESLLGTSGLVFEINERVREFEESLFGRNSCTIRFDEPLIEIEDAILGRESHALSLEDAFIEIDETFFEIDRAIIDGNTGWPMSGQLKTAPSLKRRCRNP